MDNKWRNKNFFEALKNSINGILYVITTQRNFKIQLFFAILAIVLSVLLKLNFIENIIILIVISSVFVLEFFNTIIETIIDMYTQEYNEKAKIAKDIAAGIVTIMSIFSIIIGGIIFLPKILEIIF